MTNSKAKQPLSASTSMGAGMPLWVRWVTIIATVGTCLAFGLKAFREPDLWWIIRTGEWILGHGVPRADMFSYTFEGTAWINVKWGYEVLAALFSRAGAPEFVTVLQLVGNGLIFLLLFKMLRQRLPGEPWQPAVVLSLLIVFALSEFRMTGRPEWISHLGVVSFLYLLTNYERSDSRLIFWLAPIQLLWTNMHEAYGMGPIMLSVVTMASWGLWLSRDQLRLEIRKPVRLSMAFLLVLLAVCINPYGPKMLWHPFEILGQLGANKYTMELHNIGQPAYWQWQAFGAIGLMLFIAVMVFAKGSGSWLLRPLRQFGVAGTLIPLMGAYLALSAFRNIPFFLFAAAPIMAWALYQIRPIRRLPALLPALIAVALYVTVVSNSWYEWTDSRDRYGLQMDPTYHPIGALEFIEANQIQGTAFSDYLTSACALYYQWPEFKSFIDLRDLDIFPDSFFQEFAVITQLPQAFEAAQAQWGFDYVLLYRNDFQPLHAYLTASANYALVYADPVACVYLRNTTAHQAVISANLNKDVFRSPRPAQHQGLARLVNTLFNPLFEPDDLRWANFDLEAALYYYGLGRMDLVASRMVGARRHGGFPNRISEVSGHLNLAYYGSAQDQQAAKRYAEAAMHDYLAVLQSEPNSVGALEGLGYLYVQTGNYEAALSYLRQGVNLGSLNCHLILALAYQYLDQLKPNMGYATQRLSIMEKAYGLAPYDPSVKANLGITLCEQNQCTRGLALFDELPNIQVLEPSIQQSIQRFRESCP